MVTTSLGSLRLRNAGILSAEQLIRGLMMFAVSIVIARALGPGEFGAYAYILSIVGLFVPLTVFGTDQIVLRQLVDSPDRQDVILGSAIAIRTAGAVAGIALALVLAWTIQGPASATPALIALSALSLLFLPADAFNAVFKARERMAWIALPRILVAIVLAAVMVAAVFAGAGLAGIIALRVVEGLAVGLAAILMLRRFGGGWPRLAPRRDQIATLVRQGFPLLLSAIAVLIFMRVDQVMLGALSAPETLGHYAVAVRFAELVFFVPAVLATSFYAGLTRTHSSDPGHFMEAAQGLFDAAGLLSWVLAAGVILIALLILVPAYGANYAPAVPMAAVLAFSILFTSLGVARSTVSTILGWNWSLFVCSAGGAVLNVALNFALIPAFGGMGAAIATLLSYGFAVLGAGLALPWMRPMGFAMLRGLEPYGALRRSVARVRDYERRTGA